MESCSVKSRLTRRFEKRGQKELLHAVPQRPWKIQKQLEIHRQRRAELSEETQDLAREKKKMEEYEKEAYESYMEMIAGCD